LSLVGTNLSRFSHFLKFLKKGEIWALRRGQKVGRNGRRIGRKMGEIEGCFGRPKTLFLRM
jgi:hypothetical protein